MKILIVLTSHDQLGSTGKKTGFWLEEFAAPYYELKDAEAAITLASPKGGQPPLDPKSDLPENLTVLTKRFRTDDDAPAKVASTKKLAEVSAADFDAVFYPGGHGPMWDMPDKALRDGYRERVFLMTKIDGRTKQAAARQINESLKRLQTDHVDLMQIHENLRMEDADRCFAEGGAIEALEEAKKTGKIRYI